MFGAFAGYDRIWLRVLKKSFEGLGWA